ncbi:MAG: NADH-quinone oxidoreductase subunit J [Coriobacteriia bacterium]|nr:NADH-quinone oxidoreductase subunit J [Coriobacteriia bacterium]
MSDTVALVPFALLALAAVGGAVGMLASRNVMHAAFWLLGAMLATAGLFLLLSAEFLAMAQVLVYAGAVSVLLLFVIMLTLRRREDAVRPLDASPAAAALAVGFGGLLYLSVTRFVPPTAEMPPVAPGVAGLGRVLFTEWVLPFELASLVLLVALVGAVWWSGGGRR